MEKEQLNLYPKLLQYTVSNIFMNELGSISRYGWCFSYVLEVISIEQKQNNCSNLYFIWSSHAGYSIFLSLQGDFRNRKTS